MRRWKSGELQKSLEKHFSVDNIHRLEGELEKLDLFFVFLALISNRRLFKMVLGVVMIVKQKTYFLPKGKKTTRQNPAVFP